MEDAGGEGVEKSMGGRVGEGDAGGEGVEKSMGRGERDVGGEGVEKSMGRGERDAGGEGVGKSMGRGERCCWGGSREVNGNDVPHDNISKRILHNSTVSVLLAQARPN